MHRTICDFALDLVQNSIEAESSLVILDVEQTERLVTFYLSDNGVGMDKEELEAARDPFYTAGTKHARRKVGLGIPFLVQAVELAGGEFDISSEKGSGTSARFTFQLDNIDTPPMGSLAETFFAALTYPGDFELIIHRTFSDESSAEGGVAYNLDRNKLMEAVGGFAEVGSLKLLRQYLRSQEEAVETETARSFGRS